VIPSLINSEDKKKFCDTLYRTKNFSAACQSISRFRDYVNDAIAQDDEFSRDIHNARERIVDDIEADILTKCTEGWEKEVWYKGHHVGSQTQYDPTIAMKVMALKRAEWRGEVADSNLAAVLQKQLASMNLSIPLIMEDLS